MPWKFRSLHPIERENQALKTQLVLAHSQLENKDGAMRRLELVVRERNQRVDRLIATIDQLRQQNRKVDEEADRLSNLFAKLAVPAGKTEASETSAARPNARPNTTGQTHCRNASSAADFSSDAGNPFAPAPASKNRRS